MPGIVAVIDLGRPEDAVLGYLFAPVCQPARGTRDSEDGCELVGGDAEFPVENAGVVINVREDTLGCEFLLAGLLQRQRGLEQRADDPA